MKSMRGNGKKVICLAGEIAAGKGTVAGYLVNTYGVEYLRFSDPGRDILKRLHKEINRENMSAVNSALRKVFGEGYLVDVLSRDVRKKEGMWVVLDGARKGEEIEGFREKISNFCLVYIKAEDKIRYQRLKKRAENSGDDLKTFEQFQADAQLETEKNIRELEKLADYIIDNSSSRAALLEKVDKIASKIGLKNNKI
jgi:dephospho-CoA kinase